MFEEIQRIGREIAAKHADDVDVNARFPAESLQALRNAHALSAAVPKEFGGAGLGAAELGRHCAALAQNCSASAMVLAMHHIQVACIVDRAGASAEWRSYLERLVTEQRLIASVTSEVGPSGDLRQSVAAVEALEGRVKLTKRATTISYGSYADDLLISARRSPEAMSNDQVLLLAQKGQFRLEDVGVWDTLGMRGTCSPGAVVHAETPAWQVVPGEFGEIASRTMVPYSHILWGNVWLGMATEAVTRTRALARAKARKTPGQLPATAQHLSQVSAKLQLMRSEVEQAGARYSAIRDAGELSVCDGVGYAIQMNNLKLNASEMVSEIVVEALRLAGISAYSNRGEYSCARLLRDSLSASVMINNYRLRETNATLLMVHKGT